MTIADNKHRKQRIGIAWYRPEQWERLREASVDPEKLEATHAEWLTHAEKALAGLRQAGMAAEEIDVDVEELVRWCHGQHIALNAEARARFVMEKIRKNFEPQEKNLPS